MQQVRLPMEARDTWPVGRSITVDAGGFARRPAHRARNTTRRPIGVRNPPV